MKTTILCSCICCLCSPTLFGQPSFQQAVDQRIAMYARSKDARQPTVYPELAERVEGLFRRYSIAHIVITGSSGKTTKGTVDIYIKGEEIYVVDRSGGWNLAVNQAGVFEWETGKTNGIKIKRNDDDLIDYLYYLTDPSWIMASMYGRYLNEPSKFTAIANREKKWTELRLKTPVYGFEALYVSEKPLWFCGFRQKLESGGTQELTISPPRELKELPKELAQQLKGMKFEDSPQTLRRHMVFL